MTLFYVKKYRLLKILQDKNLLQWNDKHQPAKTKGTGWNIFSLLKTLLISNKRIIALFWKLYDGKINTKTNV